MTDKEYFCQENSNRKIRCIRLFEVQRIIYA